MAQIDLDTLPRTRKEAQALESKFYFTGGPCRKGHLAAFSLNDGCEECRRERVRTNMAKHRAKVQAPLRANGIPKPCPTCGQEWMKPYGSTAAYCSDECRKTGRRTKQQAAAAKPEVRGRKNARSRERLQENRKDRAWLQAETARVVARAKVRMRTDPAFAIRRNLSSRICAALKAQDITKSFSTLEIAGCSATYLKEWLEVQFLPGMTWGNRSAWHIDHIRPCASFDLTDLEQQKECFHYSTLQPLWALDNIKKGASCS